MKYTDDEIKKVLAGKSTKENARNIAKWFATDSGTEKLSELIEQDFENSESLLNDFGADFDTLNSKNLWLKITSEIRTHKLKLWSRRIAAFSIPLLLIGVTFLMFNSRINLFTATEFEEIYIPKGETAQFIFQDGTKVFVGSDSRIKFPKKFSFTKREVYLEGEAYFQVTSDKKWPFIVNLSGPSIEVLGTSFNIQAYDQDKEIKVCLDEGSIQMTTKPENIYKLIPGDILTFDKQNMECHIENKQDKASEKKLTYKENLIVFNKTPLNEVVKILNRKYNYTFRYNNAQLDSICFTTTFRKNSIDEIIAELEDISTLSFHIDHTENVVDIKEK